MADTPQFTGWALNTYNKALEQGVDPAEVAPAYVAGNEVHEATLEQIRTAVAVEGAEPVTFDPISSQIAEVASELELDPANLTAEDEKLLVQSTFTEQDLLDYGLDQSYIDYYFDLGEAVGAATETLGGITEPTNTSLKILQGALQTVSDVGTQELGTSELFADAGLTPSVPTLSASLNQRASEMQAVYDKYKFTVGDIASAQADTYNTALTEYNRATEAMRYETDYLRELEDRAWQYEQQLNLLNQQADIEKELMAYEKTLYPEDTTPSIAEQITLWDYGLTVGEDGMIREMTILDDVDINSSGQSLVASYNNIYLGSGANPQGVDFAGASGSIITAGVSGAVLEVESSCKAGDTSCNDGWGNQVTIQDADGNIHQYSHLQDTTLFNIGDLVSAGTQLGTMGNTGYVLAGDGSMLTAEQIATGRGTHLDYTVYKPDGTKYTVEEALAFAFPETTIDTKISATAQLVLDGTFSLSDLTATEKSEIADELLANDYSNVISNEMKQSVGVIIEGLDTVLEAWKEIPDKYKGTVQGRWADWITHAEERVEEIANFNAAAGIIGMQLTRLFEKGRISDADRDFYMSLMPNLFQNEEAAIAGSNKLKELLEAKITDVVNDVSLELDQYSDISISSGSDDAALADFLSLYGF